MTGETSVAVCSLRERFVRAHQTAVRALWALLMLLERRLTDKETAAVAADLSEKSSLVSDIEIGATILFLTEKLPLRNDIDRVRHHLRRDGVVVYDEVNALRR